MYIEIADSYAYVGVSTCVHRMATGFRNCQKHRKQGIKGGQEATAHRAPDCLAI